MSHASHEEATSFERVGLAEHALVDSGGGAKLERFGEVLVARPDPQALWRPRLADWSEADLTFVRDPGRDGRRGSWRVRPGAPAAARTDAPWWVRVERARLAIRATTFKHVGLFPEQATNWRFVTAHAGALGVLRPRLLNLFGYTGAASVMAAHAGYAVTHVDASRTSLAWARENFDASDLSGDAVRVLLDDALAFARRAVRRGERYQAILVDPPHYGRGPRGEKWQFEEGIVPLLASCGELLAERALLVLSAYAIGISSTTLANLVAGELPAGEVTRGELTLAEEPLPGGGGASRLLPCGFCVRWTGGLGGS